MNNKKIGGIILAGVIGLGLIGGVMSASKIKAGYVGLIYNLNGGIENEVLPQGLHFVAPWKKVKQYSTSIEQGYLSREEKEGSKGDDSFNVPTSDGKTVNVDLEYSYHFDSKRLPETYVKFKGQDGKTIEDTFIRGKLKTWACEVTANYSVVDIYGEKRTELNKALSDHMQPLFDEYGIVLDACNFSRIELDQQTSDAIQKRIDKQQEVETTKLEAEKAEIEKQTTLIKVQTEAEATITKAKADAEANNIKSQSIDDKILKQQMIDKWDGKLPTVSGNGQNIIDIGDINK